MATIYRPEINKKLDFPSHVSHLLFSSNFVRCVGMAKGL